jgi:hypothetical protein
MPGCTDLCFIRRGWGLWTDSAGQFLYAAPTLGGAGVGDERSGTGGDTL